MKITPENYEDVRREIVEANSNLNAIILSNSEKELEKILTDMKKELKNEYGGSIPYGIPVLTDKKLTGSRLYRFASRLPKGADLHVHDMALLPMRELIELIKTCPEFYINTDKNSCDLKWVSEDETIPDLYVKFADAMTNGLYTEDELLESWTVIGHEKSALGIWEWFEMLFSRQGALSSNCTFALKYYEYTFRYYCKRGILHIEIHNMLTDDLDESLEYVSTIREAYYRVKKEYPYFTVRIIGAGVKADNDRLQTTKNCFLNTAYVKETLKDESDPENISDFVIGFDLVNEEDSSLPLKKFAPMLLKAKKQFPDMKLYIHGGESLDAENENLIDAYLLGVSRVGHGLNLYRYPDLHRRYVLDEICLEVCPISNQTLGYTKDMRNHPITEYLRTGVAVSFCSDDPAYMENETLTDDFFAGIVSWDLGVADLKQLGINSIVYSGLDEKSKTNALRAYKKQWNGFVRTYLKEKYEMEYQRQLVMRWKNDGTKEKEPQLPPDITLTTLPERENGIAEWLDIMTHGITDKLEDEGYYKRAMIDEPHYDADKCFFLLLDGKPVATVTVICDYEKKSGYIHMVACKEEARGRGLGHLLNDICLHVLKKEGMETALLTTDDWRIPAIKTYLKAGFYPDESDDEYIYRWNKIREIL